MNLYPLVNNNELSHVLEKEPDSLVKFWRIEMETCKFRIFQNNYNILILMIK